MIAGLITENLCHQFQPTFFLRCGTPQTIIIVEPQSKPVSRTKELQPRQEPTATLLHLHPSALSPRATRRLRLSTPPGRHG